MNDRKKTGRPFEVGDPLDYDKNNPCIASAIISRVAVFLPSKRNVGKVGKWEAETSWGKVYVEGRLTQNHRAVLDAIFAFPLLSTRQYDKDGPAEAVFVINPYEIAKKAGVSTDREWFESTILEELRKATVRIEEKDKSVHCGGIISEWRRDETYEHRGAIKKTTTIKLKVSVPWMRLMDESIVVRYSGLIEKIGKLESGAAQGLVRFLLTHSNARYKLKDALFWIGAIEADSSKQSVYKTLKTILENQKYLEENFGIVLDKTGDAWMLEYKKHALVSFSPPKQTT